MHTEIMDRDPPEESERQGENQKAGGRDTVHRIRQSSNGQEDSHRGRLLRKKCRAYVLSPVSPPALVCWLGSDRSRMQDGDRRSSQTIGNVLDRAGSQRDSRAAMLSSQPPF